MHRELEDSGEQVASRHHLENPFLSREKGFGALAIVDVGDNPVPLPDISVLIAQRLAAVQEPAIFSVGSATETYLYLDRLPLCDALAPLAEILPGVIRVYGGAPIPSQRLLQRQARILLPAPIEEIGMAVRPGAPNHRRNGVNCGCELFLTPLGGLLGALALRHRFPFLDHLPDFAIKPAAAVGLSTRSLPHTWQYDDVGSMRCLLVWYFGSNGKDPPIACV